MLSPEPTRTSRRQALKLLAVTCTALAADEAGALGTDLRPADSMLVVKSERRLYLQRGGEAFRTYRIALGLNPAGPKEREGDFRTPEGRYVIDARNVHSDFFLALHVSYPSETDLARAHARGVPPGGAIMIHGLPNTPKHPLSYYRTTDWTNGCIALSNDDMLEVWLLTRSDTPIEIRP